MCSTQVTHSMMEVENHFCYSITELINSSLEMGNRGIRFCKITSFRKSELANFSTDCNFCAGYKFSRASYVLSLLRPRIFRDLELKKHGLTVYLRKPSSYTPLKEEYQVSQCIVLMGLRNDNHLQD